MASKKIYAVRRGKTSGIFNDWDECKVSVEGFPGAEYKGFPNRGEAEEYLGISGNRNSNLLPDTSDKVCAYVDGSYQHSLKKYGFGCVFLLPDGRIYTENGSGDNPDSLLLRNVTGEMLGAMFAVRFAMMNGFPKIELKYDYEGIEKWVTGVWKSKTDLTRKYAEAMRDWGKSIDISFTKVAAHTNVYYNEMADRLAKEAIQNANGIPKVRRLEDMEPFREDE